MRVPPRPSGLEPVGPSGPDRLLPRSWPMPAPPGREPHRVAARRASAGVGSAVRRSLAPCSTRSASFVAAGGKRSAARCSATGARSGAGADPTTPRSIDAGAALELLHAFALIHDDVMDGCDTPPRPPTVHRRFEADARGRRLRGERRRFGEGLAILAGDLAFVYADALLARPPRRRPRRVARAARRADHGPVARPHRRRAERPLAGAGPLGRDATSRAGTPSSGRCTSAPRWPGGPISGRPLLAASAARWARRSSCATTCSACSATRRAPASRSATTCARASPRLLLALAAERASPRPSGAGWRGSGPPDLTADEVDDLRDRHRRQRRRRAPSSGEIAGLVDARPSTPSTRCRPATGPPDDALRPAAPPGRHGEQR